jgi:hypothetical protein
MRKPSHIRAFFVLLAVFFAALALLAVVVEGGERVALTVLALSMSATSVGMAVVTPRMVKWEGSGGRVWTQDEDT